MALIEIKELHLHVNLQEVSNDAKKILQTVNQILNTMATKADFDAAFADMSASISNIADDIMRLTGAIQGGLTEEEEAEVLASLQDKATQLKAIADQTPEPPVVE